MIIDPNTIAQYTDVSQARAYLMAECDWYHEYVNTLEKHYHMYVFHEDGTVWVYNDGIKSFKCIHYALHAHSHLPVEDQLKRAEIIYDSSFIKKVLLRSLIYEYNIHCQ